MTRSMTDDELLAWLEQRVNEQIDRVIEMLKAEGRPDLAKELEGRITEISNGIDGARATWSALSEAQRNVLLWMEQGGHLVSTSPANTRFALQFPAGPMGVSFPVPSALSIPGIHGRTVNNPIHHELISWAPDKKVILTERGRFVLKFGWQKEPPCPSSP